jgi:hypothetical protein
MEWEIPTPLIARCRLQIALRSVIRQIVMRCVGHVFTAGPDVFTSVAGRSTPFPIGYIFTRSGEANIRANIQDIVYCISMLIILF